MRLTNKTAVITGAGSGIGRAATERFTAEGATVIAADVDREVADETVAGVAGVPGEAIARAVDVTDETAVEETISEVAAERGLDIMVNNAGVDHERQPVEAIESTVRDHVLDVNVAGVWNGCRAAIPIMKEQGSGAIVNTASLAGVIGAPGLGAYSLSKGAVVNFTRTVAAEVGSHGIRANAVCPGITETPLVTDGFEDETAWEAAKERMVEEYPLGRLGRPGDVADAMVFLASDEAAWVTGHALVVDGGFSCA